MAGATRAILTTLGAIVMVLAATPARADLQLCNKTSYVLDLALGLEDKGAAATRGWFRVNPGQCRLVLQGAVEAERVLVHARSLPAYGAAPFPQSGHADLCVAEGNFVIAGARTCQRRVGQRLVRFTAVKPSESDKGLTANLAEEADYDVDQARLAGIQRLLVIAGYDANPIDGIEGKKTEGAMAQFLKDRKLATDAVNTAAFFDALLAAVGAGEGIGFTWCNETAHTVMAALGVEDKGTVTTRGWYRIETGKCLKPDVAGRPVKLYSFGEAVDRDGQAIRISDKPLAWGGPILLCTRDVRFELAEHADCAAKGLTATGFAPVDLAGRARAPGRLRAP